MIMNNVSRSQCLTPPSRQSPATRPLRLAPSRIANIFIPRNSPTTRSRTRTPALWTSRHDSPIDVQTWMADKLFTRSDAYPWSSTGMITWTLLHYFPNPTTGFQIYRENGPPGETNASNFVKIPPSVSAFAKEVEIIPKFWAETHYNVLSCKKHT